MKTSSQARLDFADFKIPQHDSTQMTTYSLPTHLPANFDAIAWESLVFLQLQHIQQVCTRKQLNTERYWERDITFSITAK